MAAPGSGCGSPPLKSPFGLDQNPIGATFDLLSLIDRQTPLPSVTLKHASSVCYRYAIMLEEAAIRGELRQLDTSLRLDPGQGIQTRGEAWHGMDQAVDSLGVILQADEWRIRADSRVGLHSQDPCMDIRSARPPARPVRRLVRGSAGEQMSSLITTHNRCRSCSASFSHPPTTVYFNV